MKEYLAKLNQEEHQQEKATYVKHLFTRIAGVYDLMNTVMSLGLHQHWRRYALKKINHPSPGRVLDLCTGSGDFAFEAVNQLARPDFVVGIDFCWEMLVQGRRKLATRKNGARLSFILGDALKLPFANDSFDVVTIGWGLRNLAGIQRGLQEIYRVLKRGGYFVCLDLGRPKLPLFSTFFHLYFFYLVPLLGKLILGNATPYTYLPNSLHTFPPPAELKRELEAAAFVQVEHISLAIGTMALHIAQK